MLLYVVYCVLCVVFCFVVLCFVVLRVVLCVVGVGVVLCVYVCVCERLSVLCTRLFCFIYFYFFFAGFSYFIYMADNWIHGGPNGLIDASYIWLPMKFDSDVVTIPWVSFFSR